MSEGTLLPWGAWTIAPLDVDYHQRVRCPSLDGGEMIGDFLAIGAEDMGDGWVKVLWEMSDYRSPGPFTMFRADERLVVL